MKNVISVFIIALSVLIQTSDAQSSDQVLEETRRSLKSGSSRELARYFNEAVELGFDGQKASYSKTQAEFVIRNFFQQHPPTNFDFVHRGTSKEGIRYCIGKYSSTEGAYRVVLLIKPVQGKYLIDTMDFMKE
ncbi:protein of unknown function [Catalinimonas alkaloidigena]|uniref:DUF4783 domain-containing protein n=1 Tax=Catalinimonas alkaloidigena TaxID=1075417 RepID=A0A1G9M0I7_9BACT|nr:DUF4783 domain-containing protein [Catalinimonas alkaloidigena]SDL67716.1 protein of unknown function [Catalinimonas alkaloidigena]